MANPHTITIAIKFMARWIKYVNTMVRLYMFRYIGMGIKDMPSDTNAYSTKKNNLFLAQKIIKENKK